MVPFDKDLENCLESLRRQVFRERDYYFVPDDEDKWPATMEELYANEDVQEEGTHSVLDIFRVIGSSDVDDHGTLRPLRSDELERHFRSTRPARADFEAALRRTGADYLTFDGRRWSGYCAALYVQGLPTETAIWGYSGD
ncbi:hypothetical protein ACPCHT_39195 [Nucisporomicrobium flavum]|uniref:hypothetical protein n=1 Tax=Nucisporomicrobium flavum TaxID=2785915 RepID=UPI0018F40587|nr:hypothetical protein [Nucisporomicrobium flavum]